MSKGTNVQTLEGLEREYCIEDLSTFLWSSFVFSSRKDQFVEVVHESLKECLWSSCFTGELDAWSNEKKLQLLNLLVTIIRPENEVSVYVFLTRPG